jgi:hypothetical protein
MPYHLELGSEGHSFHGKAIVVNSKTGEHKSKHPIPADKAEAQMRVLNANQKEEKVAPKKRAPKIVENRGFLEGTEEALRANPFLKKCFGEGQDMDEFISKLRMITTGDKRELLPKLTRDYNRNVYDLGEFYSRRFPKNANNVKIPARTAKLIKTISSKWELHILGTENPDTKHKDVIMTLLA